MSCNDMNEMLVEEYLKLRIPSRPVMPLIIMLSVFSVFGLFGNSLVLYVYVRKRNKLSSTVFIIALAATDLVTSAIGMPYTMVVEKLDYRILNDFSCKLYYFVITSTVPFSVFIMVAIAIDRFLCISCPHSHVLNALRARNTVIALLVVAILIGVIPSMFYGVFINMEALRKRSIHPEPMEKTVKWSLGNVTEVFALLGPNNCPQCVNHSTSETEFSDYLMKAILDLYKKVCTRDGSISDSYYTGRCLPNQIYFSERFQGNYRTIYSSSFLVCFSVVFVLYILIYRSVLVRRSRRLAARTKTKLNITHEVSLTENQSMLNDSPDKSIALTELNNGNKEEVNKQLQREQSQNKDPQQQQRKVSQNGCLRDKYFLANIRTAVMLFVVTVAFIIAYLPSWLISYKVIRFNVMVFYVYFSNHFVNPIIYAFMNPAFRRSLKGLICRKKSRGL